MLGTEIVRLPQKFDDCFGRTITALQVLRHAKEIQKEYRC